MKKILCCTLPAFLFILFALPADARDWTQWRGPDRKAKSEEPGLSKDWDKNTPKLLWTSDGLGKGYASLSVSGERMYTSGDIDGDQTILGLNRADGTVLWKTVVVEDIGKHGYPGSRTTPSLDDGHLYVVPSSGGIVCLDAEDGSIVWQKHFKKDFGGRMMSGWGFSESPLVDGDWVLCTPGAADAMIVALDKKTGKTVWKSAMPDELGDNGKDGAGYSSIVISEGAGVKQYVTLVGRGVVSVRASDGEFLWNYNPVANRTANIPTVIAEGDHVFCSSGYGTGSALLKLSASGDGVKAAEEYFLNAKVLQNHHGGMVHHKGYIYTGHKHNDGWPICVEMKTGKVVWGGDTRPPGKGSAAVKYVSGDLVFRYQDGTVALIEATPEAYKLKGAFKAKIVKGKCWAHPVILDGKMYLREQDSLMCYDVSSQ